MQIIHSIAEFREKCSFLNRSLGLIPTMGAIHDGHRALIKQASKENESVVVTIFVNPKQFSENKDFDRYPRPIETDFKSLQSQNVDLVFIPSIEEIYPPEYSTYVDVGKIGGILEGEYRPKHFHGVATIVTKLISICKPDNTYFGQKDAQQCAVAHKINSDLNLGTNIRVVPTVREKDGLAISSRNVNLSRYERCASNVLFRSLENAKLLKENGTTEINLLIESIRECISSEPLIKIDYVSIVNPITLEKFKGTPNKKQKLLALVAVKVGSVRLIDNMYV